jgi:hypothetical protein
MERNPNHPVVRELSDQWYKICAALMLKFGKTEIQITEHDLKRLSDSDKANIVADTRGDRFLTLRLVSDDEAIRLAKKEGGLPH